MKFTYGAVRDSGFSRAVPKYENVLSVAEFLSKYKGYNETDALFYKMSNTSFLKKFADESGTSKIYEHMWDDENVSVEELFLLFASEGVPITDEDIINIQKLIMTDEGVIIYNPSTEQNIIILPTRYEIVDSSEVSFERFEEIVNR